MPKNKIESTKYSGENALTASESAYLLATGQLSHWKETVITTNALAKALHATPAAVTDMVKRLAAKQWVIHQRYRGISLTPTGRKAALKAQRQRCLWEVLLVQQLKFTWAEAADLVPKLAEVQAPRLYQRLDTLLQYPRYTPTGTAIPTAAGELPTAQQQPLQQLAIGQSAMVVAINEMHPDFLQYLHKRNIVMGIQITVLERLAFDQSLEVSVGQQAPVNLSAQACAHIFVVS